MCLAGLLTLAACGSSKEPQAKGPHASALAGSKPVAVAKGSALSFATPARVFPRSLWTSPEPRSIVSGLRAERTSEGVLRVARDLLPGSDDPSALALPERLGGGFLFFTSGSRTSLFRAESWTAPLRPLATVEMPVERIEPGFDRLYLLGRRETRALDPLTGKAVSLGMLPKAASYRDVRFGPSFGALVEVPLAGVLATFDAGQSWWPVPGARSIAGSGHELLVQTEGDAVLALGEDGVFRPSALAAPTDELATTSAARERDLFARAILRGAYSPGAAGGRVVVIDRGDLHVIALESGKVVERVARVTPEDASCHSLSVEEDVLFVCVTRNVSNGGTVTEIGRILRDAWEPLWRVEETRAVLGAGPSGVLVEGPCDASAGHRQGRFSCVVSGQGVRELSHAPGDVSFSTKTGVAVVTPPRASAGKLTLPGAAPRTLILPTDRELRRLLQTGQWLPGGWQAEDGRLGLWVVGNDVFVGVRVDARGRVETGSIQRPARRALLSGRFGLLWGAAGFARETHDGGVTWSDAPFPYRTGDADPTQPVDGEPVELGCSAVGCVLGPWLRVGWGDPTARLVEAEAPRLRAPLDPGGSRLRFTCHPTNERSEPRLSEETWKEPWVGFWEAAPPTRPPRSLSFTLATLADEARVYVWGPEEGSWAERGNLQLVFRDAASFDAPSWTAVVRTPWPDARRAALAFADGGGSGIAVASVALDPGGKSGLFQLRSPAETRLFAFEAERPPVSIQDASAAGLSAIDDVVRSGDAWYTTQPFGANVRVYRVRAGRMEVAAELPLGRGAAPRVRVVRSARGEQVGVWASGEAGQVVYPLDVARGTLGTPYTVPVLSGRPAPCAAEANGYVVSEELSVAPYVAVEGVQGDVDLTRVTAELLVGGHAPCVTRLSATTRDAVRIASGAARPPSVRDAMPLTLMERRAGGRRWELLCSSP